MPNTIHEFMYTEKPRRWEELVGLSDRYLKTLAPLGGANKKPDDTREYGPARVESLLRRACGWVDFHDVG